MSIKDQIGEHYEIIGADDKHVGTVDRVEGNYIKLTKSDNGRDKGEHRYISTHLVSEVTNNQVRLSVDADIAIKDDER